MQSLVRRPRAGTAAAWQFQEVRLGKIRQGSPLFRLAEPLILELSPVVGRLGLNRGKLHDRVQLALHRGGSSLPFTTSEFLSFALFQSFLAAAASLLVLILWLEFSIVDAIAISLGLVLFVGFSAIRELDRNANARLQEVRRGLPYCIDLFALTMQAGATFRDSLATAVRETEGSAVGEEMRALNSAMAAGQPLGQGYERLAGQAHTMIVFPGFIIGIACLIAALAPFVLTAIFSGGSDLLGS